MALVSRAMNLWSPAANAYPLCAATAVDYPLCVATKSKFSGANWITLRGACAKWTRCLFRMRTFGVDGEHVDPTWKLRPRWAERQSYTPRSCLHRDRRQFEI
jgi:hypothetical protein